MSEPRGKDDKVSVLVVEDEPSIRAAICLLLEFQGYICTQASNGIDALTKMNGSSPALVITDYMMPHMDGLSLARAIRSDSRNSDLPIILITGIPPPNTLITDLVNLVMQKPIGAAVLTQAIRQVLGERAVGSGM